MKNQPSRPLTRGRKVVFAVLAAILVPAFALLVLEGVLRLAGFGYDTHFFLRRREGAQEVLFQNDKFGWLFFPREVARNPTPVRFSRHKAAGTIRIFVLGESAALGDPKPAYSFGRYLEAMLGERYPGQKFEVLPAAMTAINSHALVPIARECAALEGDYWIIYMGNNEMGGPFGVNPIAGPAAPSAGEVRASLAVKRTRVGQLLETLTRKLRGRKAEAQRWEGMKTFAEHKVAPNDPGKETIYRNFEVNLGDMVSVAVKSGAQPILCTVASNLKSGGPFASLHRTGLSAEDERTWKEAFARGKGLLSSNDFAGAAEAFDAAMKIDAEYAELPYWLGTSLAQSFTATNAIQFLEASRDADALPFRTDTRLNEIIRKTSAQRSLPLVDLERSFNELSGGVGPGDDIFFDHVHFNFLGNYQVARAVAAELEKRLPSRLAEKRSVTWPSSAACEAHLALTDWNRRAASEQMLQRISEPPFTDRPDQESCVRALAENIVALRQQTLPSAAGEARKVYEEAIRGDAGDFRLHENFAEFLEGSGRPAEAAQQWQIITQMLPDYYAAEFQAGRLLSQAGQYDAARAHLLKALELRSPFPEARIELGLLNYRQGKPGEALAQYEKARQDRPDDPRLLIRMADALASEKKRPEAVAALRQAIQVSSNYWEPHYLLGIELVADNQIAEAGKEFATAVRLRPDNALAHFNLAVALAKQGQLQAAADEFRETLRLDPGHKAAASYLQQLEQVLARKPSAP